jgi:hypothetical protein
MFNFQAVLARTQPFLSRSVRNGATNPDSNAEKWSIIVQFAVLQPSVAQQLDAGCMPTIHGQRRWQMRLPPAYAERNRDRHSTTILLKFSYERR